MGQEPNIELDHSDAPRAVGMPGAPRRWKPTRPGEISSPDEMRWGGAFGRPGPDTGWAIKLIRSSEWDRTSRSSESEAVLATFVGARASLFGRAPTNNDVEVGLLLMGFRPDEVPPAVVKRLVAERHQWLDKSAHEHNKGAAFVGSIDPALMAASPDRVRTRLAAS